MHRPSDDGQTHNPGPGFDTTAELWDRIADDLAAGGQPCLETVQRLVDEACHWDPSTSPPAGPAPDKDRGPA